MSTNNDTKDSITQEEVILLELWNYVQINFLKEIFYVSDKQPDGDISCVEIKSLLSKFGFEHSLKDIDEMIQEKDLDQDGRISFDEFVHILRRDTSSIGNF